MSERRRTGYSRRDVLRGGAAAIASSSVVLSPSTRTAALAQGTPDATADFNWRRYEGESINVLLAVSPRADLLVEYEPEFEELTGITANTDVVPEQQQRQKQVIEFTSGNPSFDVTAVSWHVQKGLFGKG
jgi:multiple sugar transport system substrate-binding protein